MTDEERIQVDTIHRNVNALPNDLVGIPMAVWPWINTVKYLLGIIDSEEEES